MRVGRYSIVRYIHNIARDEAINIGVAIEEGDTRLAITLEDFAKVAKREPEADLRMIELWTDAFTRKYVHEEPLSLLHRRFCNNTQLTEPRVTLLEGTLWEEAVNWFKRLVEE